MSSYGETIVTADRVKKIAEIRDLMKWYKITVAEVSLSYDELSPPDPEGRDEVEYHEEFYKYVSIE